MTDSDKGYPALQVRIFKDEAGEQDKSKSKLLNEYLLKWQCPTVTYNGRLGIRARVPEFFEEIDKSCPEWTHDELKTICGFVNKYKVIPTLGYAPEEYFNYLKKVWWLVPFVIWKEDVASWVLIDKNGFYAPHPDDNDVKLIYTWDTISEIDYEWDEDCLCTLTLYDNNEGYLTFSEFVPEGCGSYLSVIMEIYKIYKPVIEASRGNPTWKHGAGKEGYAFFNKSEDLLIEENWKNANYPDPSFFA